MQCDAGTKEVRDRYFYLILAALAVVLFDIYSPTDFSTMISALMAKEVGIPAPISLEYIRSIVFFLLLGFTIRYCQAALYLERHYKYLHSLEGQLETEFKGTFTLEGQAYLHEYPLFLNWAHYLYTLVFPVLLLSIVAFWVYREIRGWPRSWTSLVWFDCFTAAAIWISVILYLFAFHGWTSWRKKKTTKKESA